MLLLRADRLPEGTNLEFEVKLDSYRAIAFKSGGRVPCATQYKTRRTEVWAILQPVVERLKNPSSTAPSGSSRSDVLTARPNPLAL